MNANFAHILYVLILLEGDLNPFLSDKLNVGYNK